MTRTLQAGPALRRAHVVAARSGGPRSMRATLAVPTGRPAPDPAAGAAERRPRRRAGRVVRLTRRGRVVVVLVALVLLVVGFSAGRVAGQAAGPSRPVTPATVTVHPGETLWQVARRVAPDVDPRLVVAQIERINHLSGGLVQAGQQLVVPRRG